MLAERNRLLVTVGGDVMNLEDGYCDSRLGARRHMVEWYRAAVREPDEVDELEMEF